MMLEERKKIHRVFLIREVLTMKIFFSEHRQEFLDRGKFDTNGLFSLCCQDMHNSQGIRQYAFLFSGTWASRNQHRVLRKYA
jgi:hypothetical protein